VPDLEVRSESLDGGGAELFGDEYDGLAHVMVLGLGDGEVCGVDPRRPKSGGMASHDAVPASRS
jgi:hypothetical protein